MSSKINFEPLLIAALVFVADPFPGATDAAAINLNVGDILIWPIQLEIKNQRTNHRLTHRMGIFMRQIYGPLAA